MRGFGTKEKPRDDRKENGMDSEFTEGAKSVQDDVKEHPGERTPPRPVPAPEHKHSKEYRQGLAEFDQDAVPTERSPLQELTEVVNKAHDAYSDKQASENRDPERPFAVIHALTLDDQRRGW